jgi:hypothetical protein
MKRQLSQIAGQVTWGQNTQGLEDKRDSPILKAPVEFSTQLGLADLLAKGQGKRTAPTQRPSLPVAILEMSFFPSGCDQQHSEGSCLHLDAYLKWLQIFIKKGWGGAPVVTSARHRSLTWF